jgi:hypothetical protein
MERLIYTNAIGQSIEFSSGGIYQWTKVDDLGALDASFQTSSSPYQDGTTSVGDPYFEPRVIKLELQIVSTDLQAAIRDLNRILNPKIGMGRLTYERDGVKRVLNKVKTRTMPALPGGESRGVGFQMSSIIFMAFNPYYTDENYTEASVSTGGLGLEFPLNITDTFRFDYLNTTGVTVTNAGDVECPVTIILDGPMTSPLEIQNITTGEKIVLAMDLLENEQLTITTEIDNINVILKDLITGTESVAFQYIDVTQTSFFYLAQGTNTIVITADEAEMESATIKFKQQYVGV